MLRPIFFILSDAEVKNEWCLPPLPLFAFMTLRGKTLPFFLMDCDIQRTVHRGIFLRYNQRDALISQICFWNRTLHVLDSFSVHHQESNTVHTAIGVCPSGYAVCTVLDS